MASKSIERRLLVRGLDDRIKVLEAKLVEFTATLSKLDSRIQKIADLIAQQVSRSPLV